MTHKLCQYFIKMHHNSISISLLFFITFSVAFLAVSQKMASQSVNCSFKYDPKIDSFGELQIAIINVM